MADFHIPVYERIAEREVCAGARREVDARREQRVIAEPRGDAEVELVDQERGIAARVDRVEALHARRLTKIGDVAARVDRRREQIAVEHPRVARAIGERHVPGVAAKPRAVALDPERADVPVAADLDREARPPAECRQGKR